MLQLVGLGKHYQGRQLFHDVNWQVRDGERIGLTGPNGAGKTTLLRLLAGVIAPDEGSIVAPRGTTVGYLPQDGITTRGRPLLDEVRSAFSALTALEAERRNLEAALIAAAPGAPESLALATRFAEVEQAFRDGGGFEIEGQMARVLSGLGFERADYGKDCGHFSGGWQMRIALAKLLLAKPNLLLLDEPTNHLDIEAREWLEEFLRDYPYSVILVSHDRHFLDAVVDRITEVSPQGLLDFTGGYTRYLVLRAEHFARVADHNRRLREEIARLNDLADRFGAKATKAAQAQTWRKQAEKLEADFIPEAPPRGTIHFRFPAAPPSGKIALTLERVGKSYGERRVLEAVDLIVNRGERVALVGVNGAGKSTLMRVLAERERHEGRVVTGHNVVPAYFAQDQASVLRPEKTVLDEASDGAPFDMVPKLRGMLGSFLFSGDDVNKPVGVLSGGERNRLALVKLLLRPANLLLLDEPTNHLDLDSKDVLLDALKNFEGTIVFVSHDRYFLDELATKVVRIEGGHAETYPGTYAEYVWKRGRAPEAHLPAAAAPAALRPEPPPEKNQRIADREAKKAAERERRQLEKRLAEVEASITAVEHAIAEAERALTLPENYSDGEKSAALSRVLAEKKASLDGLMPQWEAAQTALLAINES